MRKEIANKTFDNERALYNIEDTDILNCIFAGAADGESVLKECKNYTVNNCKFSLRYPMWHAKDFSINASSLDEKARAPIWYCNNGKISNCEITSIKCLRECNDIQINRCNISSEEFGWKCNNINFSDSNIIAKYIFFDSKNIFINNINMTGKYSFQYVENMHIQNSKLDTKDAFWHSKNITVENSRLKGEYLGWFSENLTLINCKIIGTQPLCYCQNLTLKNCIMEKTDLSFEYSDVKADITGRIDSVKNPKSGIIKAESIGEIILENQTIPCNCKIEIKEKENCV